MILFIIIFLLIFISLFLNIIIWNIKIPKNHSLSILFIFLIIYIVFLFTNFFNISFLIFHRLSLVELIHITIFYFMFLFTYLVAYTSVDKDSPTMMIVMQVFNSGRSGLNNNELKKSISNDKFIKTRIDSLLESNLIFYKENKYMITKKGKFSISIMFLIHKIINQQNKSA